MAVACFEGKIRVMTLSRKVKNASDPRPARNDKLAADTEMAPPRLLANVPFWSPELKISPTVSPADMPKKMAIRAIW